MTQFFESGGQSIEASMSASVLPMSIQGWFPLGLTDLNLLSVQHALKSLLQHNSKASVLWCSTFFIEVKWSEVKVTQSCPTLCDPKQPTEFSRPECWNGEPFPPLGDHPNPGIKLRSICRQILYLLSHKSFKNLKIPSQQMTTRTKISVPPGSSMLWDPHVMRTPETSEDLNSALISLIQVPVSRRDLANSQCHSLDLLF